MEQTRSLIKKLYNISDYVLDLCFDSEQEIIKIFDEIEKTAEYNSLKVLHAMQMNRLSESHFGMSTGYGYNDLGRDCLEQIYADVFKTESALVRPQIISGTHAITLALFGNLRHGDRLLAPAGKLYDTLDSVIGLRESRGSLIEHGISYGQVDLDENGSFDYDQISCEITTNKPKLCAIQRSKGYSWRHSFHVEEIGELISFIKNIDSNIICMVDNCYGEFVDIIEPSQAGADLVVGSLIKNPGGGIASVGGYIAGRHEYVENAAYRLSAPGLGKEIGPGLGMIRQMAQGLYFAPDVVANCLKGAVLLSRICDKLKIQALPRYDGRRSDIVQAIRVGTAERQLAFCRGIQRAAAVDSYLNVEQSDMPGYDSPIVMASGSFTQGSSVELSADGPVKEPYTVFYQGGLTWSQARLGVIMGIEEMVKIKDYNHYSETTIKQSKV